MPCPDVFVQDVPAALTRKGLCFTCYLDPGREAILDAAHMVRVNYETYFFADTASKALFEGDVVRFAGMLTDPVSKRRFRPTDDDAPVEHEGVMYYFESDETYLRFMADPEMYRLPGYVMERSVVVVPGAETEAEAEAEAVTEAEAEAESKAEGGRGT